MSESTENKPENKSASPQSGAESKPENEPVPEPVPEPAPVRGVVAVPKHKRKRTYKYMKRIDVAIVFKNNEYKQFTLQNSSDVVKFITMLCNALRETGDISSFILTTKTSSYNQIINATNTAKG